MQIDAMRKHAALTVRIPLELKERVAARAKRERRSLSAQVAHELMSALAREQQAPLRRGHFLGSCEGARLPSDRDFAEVRARLWGALPRRSRRA
jgi:Arc-like DNA binding dprotein